MESIDECSDHELRYAVLFAIRKEYCNLKNSAQLGQGPFISYLWLITYQKFKKALLESYVKTSHLKAIQQLVMLRLSMMKLDLTNMIFFIESLLKEKELFVITNIAFEFLND